MDTLEAIRTRRSVRKYKHQSVPKELVRELLAAAMQAPSAGNQQPWHFIVVDDRKLLDQIPAIHPHARMAKGASLGILICGDPRLEKHEGYWIQDCAAATENLLLAAHAKGLGAVWTGVYPREGRVKSFRQLFGAPEEVVPFSFIVMGWPDEPPSFQNRFSQDRVHHNAW